MASATSPPLPRKKKKSVYTVFQRKLKSRKKRELLKKDKKERLL
jgi:hypothetical protein